jgi:hypothetical protein
MKPLDSINVPATGLLGLAIFVLSMLANPQVQAALTQAVTNITPQQVITSLGVIAGVILAYIGKPIGTSSAPKSTP